MGGHEINTVEQSAVSGHDFDEINRLADEISDQNVSYYLFRDPEMIATKELRDIALDHLESLQVETFTKLSAAGEAAPYSELYEEEQELWGRIQVLKAGLATAALQKSAKVVQIGAEQELIVERLPELAGALEPVVNRLQASAIEAERIAREQELEELYAEYSVLLGLYEKAGKPWPIPTLIDPKAIKADAGTIADIETVANVEQAIRAPEICSNEGRDKVGVVEPRSEPKWLHNFKIQVTDVIAKFEVDGVMTESITPAGMLRLSSSGMMGTQEMLRRGIKNGILGRNESDPETDILIYKFVCMALQNTHRELFTNHRKRRVVLKIVQKMVSDHFAKKSENGSS